jgi:hypothetical protein
VNTITEGGIRKVLNVFGNYQYRGEYAPGRVKKKGRQEKEVFIKKGLTAWREWYSNDMARKYRIQGDYPTPTSSLRGDAPKRCGVQLL